jgi:hypothetical protein
MVTTVGFGHMPVGGRAPPFVWANRLVPGGAIGGQPCGRQLVLGVTLGVSYLPPTYNPFINTILGRLFESLSRHIPTRD